jgi:N-acetylmuramoyl-L-alanine amidase
MDGGRDDIYGIETYYSHNNSARLAYILHRNIVAKTGAPDRRVRIRNLYVTNQNSVPAVLLEVGFLSNTEERARLQQSAYQDTIVEAIAQGLIEYLK